MTTIGYARVSSVGQNLDIQTEQLSEAGCERLFTEKVSGATAQRPQLKALRSFVREGDVVVCCKLDRLARSLQDLLIISSEFESAGVRLRILNMGLDTSTPHGKLMLQMLGSVAEFENSLRRERQLEGIAKAKENNIKFGRPSREAKLFPEFVELRAEGHSMGECSKRLRISVPTLYRWQQRNSEATPPHRQHVV